MTKEDYMALPKERLAELLVERDNMQPFIMQQRPLCYEPNGICTNPQRDCINCPKIHYGGDYYTITTTTINNNE